MFKKVFRQRMVDCFQQDWASKLNSSTRFNTYCTFKSLLKPEPYLSYLTVSKFKKYFTRFRLGLNDLNVNIRYKENVKTCPFCNQLENELHFLLKCKAYDPIRDKYILKHRQFRNGNVIELKQLLANSNVYITRDVAMYIYYALKKREELTSISSTLQGSNKTATFPLV